MKKTLLTFRSYAKHRGVSVEAVSQAVKLGRITTIGSGDKRKIDPEIADGEWDSNTKINYKPGSAPVDKASDERKKEFDKTNSMYNKSRAIKEIYSAKLEKAKYEELIGKLVSAEKVKNGAFKTARILRDKILNIPDRISHELASEKDPHKITIILTRALQEALEELTNDGNSQPER